MPRLARRSGMAGALAALVVPVFAGAQQLPSCRAPEPMPVPRAVAIPRGEAVQRDSNGGYLLALSWSPQHCATTRDPTSPQNRDQCSMGAGKGSSAQSSSRYGWILHGLWPQSAKGGHPRWCRAARIVPKQVLRETFCVTPSAQLMQYQWAKHGTCMSPDPASYFSAGASLYRKLKFPDMAALAQKPQNSGSVRRAFALANKGMDDRMFAVVTDGQGWLREVRLCLDMHMRPRACGTGQQGLLGARRILIRR